MNKIEIVKSFLKEIEQCNFSEAKKYLSDDFQLSGPMPKAMNADQYLGLHEKISKGVPNFHFNASDFNESGNTVNLTVSVGGKQTNELPALMEGMSALPATNKKFHNPNEDVAVSFKGDKIEKMTVEKVPDGGVLGMLKQLGAKVPAL